MMIEVMTVVISAIAEEQGSDVVKKKVRLSRPSPFCTFFFRGGLTPGRETKSALPVQTRSPQDPAADLLSGEEDSEKYFIKLPHAPIRNATRRSRWPP